MQQATYYSKIVVKNRLKDKYIDDEVGWIDKEMKIFKRDYV